MQKYIKFGLYLIIVVLVNLICFSAFQRYDLTKNKAYSLSEISRESLTNLSDPLTINVFFSGNLPAPYNGIETYLRDLLAEYALTANRHFKYNFYNVSTQEGELSEDARENQRLAASYGIEPMQIQAVEKDEVKFQRAYMGMVVVYGDQMEKIDPISTTDGLEYKITSAVLKLSRKINVYATLEDKVLIDFYLSPNLKNVAPALRIEPAKFERLVTDMNEMVTKLNATSFNKLEYSYHPSANTRDDLDAADEYDLLVMEWPDVPEAGISGDHGIIGIAVRYQNNRISIPLLNIVEVPNFGMSYYLTEGYQLETALKAAVDSVVGVNDAVGYLADHGNPLHQSMGQPGIPEPEDSLLVFGDLVSKNYSFKDIFMNKPGAMQGTQAMLIVSPTRAFSDYELFLLDQYLMQGNNLIIYLNQFIDIANQEPSMNPMMKNRPVFAPQKTGLEKLLQHYAGLTVTDAVILDKNCWRQPLPPEMGGGDRPIYMAPILNKENINSEPIFMRNLPALVFLKVSPLNVDMDYAAQQGIKVTELLRSSSESWLLHNITDLNPSNIPEPANDQEYTSYPFAYMLEGEFTSYFTGKEIPREQGSATAEADTETGSESSPEIKVSDKFIASGKPGKIFIISTADALGDNILDEEAQTPNAIFVLNVLDYMNGQTAMAVMRSKTQAVTLLDVSTAQTKTLAKYINIAVVPVLVLVCGLLAWTLRKQRQRKIRARFAIQQAKSKE